MMLTKVRKFYLQWGKNKLKITESDSTESDVPVRYSQLPTRSVVELSDSELEAYTG